MRTDKGTLLLGAMHDLRRTWPQMIAADIMAKILAFAILTPLTGLLLKLFLATTATGVVADEAIASFLLHPIGLVTLVVITSVSVAIFFVENSVLMIIGLGAAESRRVTWLDAIRYTQGRSWGLLQLAGQAVARLLLLLLPFIAAIGGMYLLFLQAYDINYYLTEKPPVFINVLIAAGFLAAVAALLIINRIARWILALSMVLFERKSGKEALQASLEATKTDRYRVTRWLLLWLVAVALLFAAVTYLASFLGNLFIPEGGSDFTWLLVGLSISCCSSAWPISSYPSSPPSCFR